MRFVVFENLLFRGFQFLSGFFPESGFQLGEQFQGVLAEDLAADQLGVVHRQISIVDFLGEDFREPAAVNSVAP